MKNEMSIDVTLLQVLPEIVPATVALRPKTCKSTACTQTATCVLTLTT